MFGVYFKSVHPFDAPSDDEGWIRDSDNSISSGPRDAMEAFCARLKSESDERIQTFEVRSIDAR